MKWPQWFIATLEVKTPISTEHFLCFPTGFHVFVHEVDACLLLLLNLRSPLQATHISFSGCYLCSEKCCHILDFKLKRSQIQASEIFSRKVDSVRRFLSFCDTCRM